MACNCRRSAPDVGPAKAACACEDRTHCTCATSCGCGSKTRPLRPPGHPDSGSPVRPQDGACACRDERPPLVVPADGRIRCRPEHRELRPAWSFWDCLAYVLFGWGAAGPFRIVEPPQTLEPAAPPEPLDDWPDVRDLFPLVPVPEVATADDGRLRCGVPHVRSPRFVVVDACPAHDTKLRETPTASPVAPEHKGGGGGGVYNPCTCVCRCPQLLVGEGIPLDPEVTGTRRPWPWFPPLFPPFPRDEDRPTRLLPPLDPDVPPRLPPLPFPPVREEGPLVVAGDAPPENVFPALCPWCGQLRPRRSAAATTIPATEVRDTPRAGVAPPQFFPLPATAPGEDRAYTTRSVGTVAVPPHPLGDAGVRSAHQGPGIFHGSEVVS